MAFLKSFQLDAFQSDIMQSGEYLTSASAFVFSGRQKFLETTFIDIDLYLGLWKGSLSFNTDTILSDISSYELINSEYTRIKISKANWILDKLENSVYLNTAVLFNPITENWGVIGGYFISTSADNTGKLINIESFTGNPINITQGLYFSVEPKFKVFG